MEIPVSFQLQILQPIPGVLSASIDKLPFFGKSPIKAKAIPKGFAGSWNDTGISISLYSFVPIDIYSALHNLYSLTLPIASAPAFLALYTRQT